MKLSQLLAPPVAVVALSLAAMAAQAAPLFELKVSDGFNPDLMIIDQVLNDGQPLAGFISYVGSYGGYAFNILGGTSSGDPLNMHLSAAVQVVGPVTHLLTFTLTQTELSLGTPGDLLFKTTGGGGTGSSGTVQYGTYIDQGNNGDNLFSTATSLAPICNLYDCGTVNSTRTLAGAYSASIQAVFNYTSVAFGDSGSVDLSLKSVPEPTSIALAGLALLGLGFARRNKA